jgi:ferric-dicitrate binding protein FerR (iron transport regulator)
MEQPDSQSGGDAREDNDLRQRSSASSTATSPYRRSIVLSSIGLGVFIAVAVVYALSFRDDGPSLATSGLVQGEVLVRAPGRPEWEPLRGINAPIVPGTELRATEAGRLGLTLADGASLRLDAGTDLTIASARRFELTRGAAYVDVGATVLGEPYAIATPYATVSEIGSQIEATVADDSLRLRVRDGEASIVTTAGDDVTAATGEQLHIDGEGDVVRDYVMPHDGDWAWVETLAGTPIVDGRPLTQFLDWVARETGRPIRYDSPLTETSVATAVLQGNADNLTPMQALDVMLSMTEFDYSLRWDGSIVIEPRP